MGLFDRFTKEGKFMRHVRRMSDRDAQPEDREASARVLAEDGSPKAVMGLLSRFDIKVTQMMKDKQEKEFAYNLLLNVGKEKVERPIRAHFRKCKDYAWPLKLMVALEGQTAAVEQVYELLEGPVGQGHV